MKHWREAMRENETGVIEREGEGTWALISGPGGAYPGYDVRLDDPDLVFLNIPDENGVQRVLEEFEIPRKGWR